MTVRGFDGCQVSISGRGHVFPHVLMTGSTSRRWDFPGRQAGKRLFSPPSPFFLFFLFGSQMAQGAGGLFVAVPDGFQIPFFRLFIVLLNAVAVGVAVAHIKHGCGVALFCRLKVPFQGFFPVDGRSFSVQMAPPQVELGCCMPLFCGFGVPVDGFGHVHFHAPAVAVAPSQRVLGRNLALKG